MGVCGLPRTQGEISQSATIRERLRVTSLIFNLDASRRKRVCLSALEWFDGGRGLEGGKERVGATTAD